jgi:hypothetical protein
MVPSVGSARGIGKEFPGARKPIRTPNQNPELTAFISLIRDPISSSFRIDREDLDYEPFDAQGGLGRMHQLFGEQLEAVISDLNENLGP